MSFIRLPTIRAHTTMNISGHTIGWAASRPTFELVFQILETFSIHPHMLHLLWP